MSLFHFAVCIRSLAPSHIAAKKQWFVFHSHIFTTQLSHLSFEITRWQLIFLLKDFKIVNIQFLPKLSHIANKIGIIIAVCRFIRLYANNFSRKLEFKLLLCNFYRSTAFTIAVRY